jgi:hypothetical protein
VWDHFKTQMPYALFCGSMALLLGFLPAGYGMHPSVGILMAIFVSPAISNAISRIPGWGGDVPTYSAELDGFIGEGLAGSKASLMSYIKPGSETATAVPAVKDVKYLESQSAQ